MGRYFKMVTKSIGLNTVFEHNSSSDAWLEVLNIELIMFVWTRICLMALIKIFLEESLALISRAECRFSPGVILGSE